MHFPSAQLQSPVKSRLLLGTALMALLAGILFVKFALWHANVLMNDWAFYNSSFWNTNFQNLWMFSHDRFVVFGYKSYLNEHFAPLLFVLAALYHWVPWPEAMLLVLHGASPVLAAIGIYATAVQVLKDRNLAVMIALSYALSPGILWPTISLVYGFQPDSLLPPLAAAMGWALATNRMNVYFVAFVLALGVKENIPAYGVILGICLFLFTERRGQAVWTIVLSLLVFAIASKGVSAITGVENRNVGAAWKFIDDLLHLRPKFDYTRAEIIIAIAYGSAFLPALFVWPFMAMIIPDALLIGQVAYAKTVTWHVMLPVTVLAIGSVFGSKRILETSVWPARLDRYIPRPRVLRLYWAVVLIVSLLAAPLTLWIAYDRYIVLRVTVDQGAVATALKLIPAEAGVIVTSDLDQYFVRRRVVTNKLDVVRQAPSEFSYFAVNRRALTPERASGINANANRIDQCFVNAAEQSARSGGKIVLDSGGILVVQTPQLPPLICS
jgi:uncharacterized membrane protein